MKHSQPSIEDVDMAGQKLARSSKTLVKRAASADNKTNNGTTSKKSRPLVIDDSEEEPLPKSSPPQPASKAPSPKKKTEIQEPASSPTKGKFNYHEYMMRKSAGPSAPGSKEIPAGAPDCLEGLTFVFTGELESLRREEAQDLVKRYGGRVTGAPSGKTSFVVVGEGAGASKLAKIEALGLKTLTEDGLLDLIRSSNTTKGEANDKKETTGRTISISPVKVESVKAPKREHHVSRQSKVIAAHGDDIANELWTDKYAPLSESDLIGNHSNYGKLVAWLEGWNSGQTSDRSVLLSGPPGIGKTTSALLACKQAGFEYVEMNASDTRSKSSLHERVRDIIDNRSLAGFVDFFGSIKIPIICICNDRSSPKVRSLANYCLDLRFRRPDARSVTPRIMAIAQAEGLELGLNTVEQLVSSTQGDIRQIINLLSTFRLTGTRMNFDESKLLGGSSRKDVDQGPFDAVPALLGPAYDRMGLGEKIDQYFIDSSLVPLMVYENYARTRANAPRSIKGRLVSTATDRLAHLKLAVAAIDSISEADLVDSLIRGANQEWSLAPLHAVMSSVRPAYFCHGTISGRVEFASWLGQNSKQLKTRRLLAEVAKHTYLTLHATWEDFRLFHLDRFAERLLEPLVARGMEGISETIVFMDDYDLCRDDFDTIVDLSLNPRYNASVFSKLPTALKSAFTRTYNQGVHRLPYSIGTTTAVVKKIAIDDGEAIDDDEEMALTVADDNGKDSEGEQAEEDDLSKDKMIKAKTSGSKRATPSRSTTGRGRGRAHGRGK